jgi:hypothetical protein
VAAQSCFLVLISAENVNPSAKPSTIPMTFITKYIPSIDESVIDLDDPSKVYLIPRLARNVPEVMRNSLSS